MKLRLLSVAIATSVSVPLYTPLALGQAGVLEEILVTAQRREEDLQSVPVAITVLSADTLDRLGISDPQAMADFVPNVSIGDGTGRANVGAQFSIRGINEARISPVLDPAVGVYIDDVYYGRPFTNFLRLLDVERVEVLRGPQGTLFGKNSTGGAIRYVTVKPDIGGGVSGDVMVGLGDYDRANVQAAINVPLGDNAAARFAYSVEEPGLRLLSNKDYRWAGGFQWGALEHLTNAQQETDSTGIFAQVDWQFSENFTLTLSGFEGERLLIDVAGATRIAGNDGRYDELDLSLAGAGDVELDGFVFIDAHVNLAGASSLRLTMDGGALTGAVAGASAIRYFGTVSRQAVDVAGFSIVEPAEL